MKITLTSQVRSLWFVRHDLIPRSAGSGYPETSVSGEGGVVPVTSELRDLIIAAHKYLHPEFTEAEVVNGLSKVYRNNGGWNNGADNGWDGDFRLGPQYPGGWTLEAVVPGPSPTRMNFGGDPYIEARCLDVNHLPTINSLADVDPTRWPFMTTALQGGSNPFPGLVPALLPIVRNAPTTWAACINRSRHEAGLDDEGLMKVDRVQNPYWPYRWDLTAGLIDP